MGIEEGTGKEIGGRRNANATMDVRSYDGWKSILVDNESRGTRKESLGNEVENV